MCHFSYYLHTCLECLSKTTNGNSPEGDLKLERLQYKAGLLPSRPMLNLPANSYLQTACGEQCGA
jgi:hypothetical protein